MSSRSCAFILQNNEVLMIRQFYKGEELWTFPGGRIEDGESPEEAAVREVKEETNLSIEVTDLIVEMYSERINGTYYCYSGRIVGGQLSLGSDPEHEIHKQELKEVKWIPVDEVKEHVEVKRILEQINL